VVPTTLLYVCALALQAACCTNGEVWPVYNESRNFCYLYPSAVFDKLGKPAKASVLCSKDSVELLSVSATGGSQAHQWGSLALDMPASGQMATLYGLDNIFDYMAVTHYYLCGVALQQQFPAAGGTVLQSTDGFVLQVQDYCCFAYSVVKYSVCIQYLHTVFSYDVCIQCCIVQYVQQTTPMLSAVATVC
jgi:hypothetical protein